MWCDVETKTIAEFVWNIRKQMKCHYNDTIIKTTKKTIFNVAFNNLTT